MVCQIAHSLYISSFMEKKAQLAFEKQVIFIEATSRGLITLRGVLIIHFYFCFTLTIMFNSSFVWGGGGGVDVVNSCFEFNFFFKSNFCISLLVLVISFQLFGCYLHVFFSFFCCFVSHMSWVGA